MAIVFDFRKMKEFEEKLKSKTKVKLGILHDNRQMALEANSTKALNGKNAVTNAEIGYKHEFGRYSPELNKRLPVRSFLRMPLRLKFQTELEKKKFYKEEMSKLFFTKTNDPAFFKMIGLVGQKVVLDAFKTGGYGQWKPSVMSFKQNHQTLVESGQLQRSIAYEVIWMA